MQMRIYTSVSQSHHVIHDGFLLTESIAVPQFLFWYFLIAIQLMRVGIAQESVGSEFCFKIRCAPLLRRFECWYRCGYMNVWQSISSCIGSSGYFPGLSIICRPNRADMDCGPVSSGPKGYFLQTIYLADQVLSMPVSNIFIRAGYCQK